MKEKLADGQMGIVVALLFEEQRLKAVGQQAGLFEGERAVLMNFSALLFSKFQYAGTEAEAGIQKADTEEFAGIMVNFSVSQLPESNSVR